MATQYPNSLSADVWEGSVNNVTIRWKEAAKERLYAEAGGQGVDLATMKALTEHFLHAVAIRRSNTAVAVRSVPHDFTIDSSHPERGQQPDPNHISGEISGGPNGRRDLHVYLSNLGTGSDKYNNVTVNGESLTQKSRNGRQLDPASWGVSTFNGGSTAGPPAPASTSTTTSSDVEWVWDEDYQKYRYLNTTTNQWVWQE